MRYFVGFLTCFSLAAHAQSVSFRLMHTQPVCSNPGKPDTWCSEKDKRPSAAKAGLETAVAQIIDRALDPKTSKITLAYLSFSNGAIRDKLCEKAKKGFSVEVFLDTDTNFSGGKLVPDVAALAACSPNIHVGLLGSKSPWRLHHNKFLMVDPGGTAPISLNFSSGNASDAGLSIHFDHWVMMSAARDSDIVRTHECVIQGLRAALAAKAAADPSKKYWQVYRGLVESCIPGAQAFGANPKAWIEKEIAREQIAPLFSPDPKDRTKQALIDHINRVVRGGRISGAIQRFTNDEIAIALANAQARGVAVALIMDDDVVSGDTTIVDEWVTYKKFLRGKVGVRFIVTNAGGRQMMHNKFLVLEGVDRAGKTRVFSGAGQFTGAAMKDNFENFYFTENASLTAQYESLYAWLEKLSVEENKVPRRPRP